MRRRVEVKKDEKWELSEGRNFEGRIGNRTIVGRGEIARDWPAQLPPPLKVVASFRGVEKNSASFFNFVYFNGDVQSNLPRSSRPSPSLRSSTSPSPPFSFFIWPWTVIRINNK